ncbi:hypothetical protein Nepgr_016563 [Nepenthes gracilis]|uniref:Uncharacterized protein n=1 Tax=Nepenthes gracilis TaxID=150966 RepID=A0AAD3SPF5_NEPGR|nr:hypothetical protein Nepgr_016563 [Nepenthes gracilis]
MAANLNSQDICWKGCSSDWIAVQGPRDVCVVDAQTELLLDVCWKEMLDPVHKPREVRVTAGPSGNSFSRIIAVAFYLLIFDIHHRPFNNQMPHPCAIKFVFGQ